MNLNLTNLKDLRKEAQKAIQAYRKVKNAARHKEFYGHQEGK
jgi:hypothetical protein